VVYTFFVGGDHERNRKITDDEVGCAGYQGKEGMDGALDARCDGVLAAVCYQTLFKVMAGRDQERVAASKADTEALRGTKGLIRLIHRVMNGE
jgi:hypothetical protein